MPEALSAGFGDPGHGDAIAYDLPARGYAGWDILVRTRPGTPAGRYVVAAQISDDLGQVIEDTAVVEVGGPGEPDLYRPLDEVLPLIEASQAATSAELGLTVLTPGLRLAPGGSGELAVELASGLASQVRGEAQLVSPAGTWESLGPWTQGFRVDPGDRVTLRYRVTVPATARPGTLWWAVVKVMYFGRVRYTEAVPVTVIP